MSSDACTPVPAGKYANSNRQISHCPPGQYQDEEGQTSCKLCQAGKYQNENGKSFCTKCSAGEYALQYVHLSLYISISLTLPFFIQ